MEKNCKARWLEHKNGRISDLKRLWKRYSKGNYKPFDDIGTFNEYGLCFDYVEGGTKYNPDAGYFRYQISTGDPGDEFRFYCDASNHCYKITYTFLDCYGGCESQLQGKDLSLMEEILKSFKNCGSLDHVMEETIS